MNSQSSTPNVTENMSGLNLTSSGSAGKTIAIPEDPHTEGGAGNHQNMDSTLFVDDANIVRRDESAVISVDSALLDIQNTDKDYQSIKSFLAKPIILQTGSFNVTDTFTFLNTIILPYPLFTALDSAVWVQKLSGIYGIRFDMRFRLVVNANRFQQGRYCLGYVALCSPQRSTSNLKEINVTNMHMGTLVQRTTVPHVELDLCQDTACELLVPFQSVQPFYNFQQFLRGVNDQALGSINIYPYSPLVSPAGSTTCGYTLYASLENITLFGAASAQGPKGLQDKELGNKSNGPISGVAHAISKGFKAFAQIPLLSEYALPVSWVADRVANVASVFGFAKPTQGDGHMKVTIMNAPNHNTIDGDSEARPMSYLSKPSVTLITGLSATQYDEMDFSYLVRKYAWFQTTAWTTGSISGTVLTTIPVKNTYSVSLGGATHYQPVSFVSSFFSLWRGSIKFKIKVVRTEFHSGRIQIAFFPGTDGAVLTGNSVYVHRMIVDIRETPEMEFIVPYISQTTYSSWNTGVGSVVVSVIDPLVAPATVSSGVTLLFEVCGGEDFEVAIPRTFGQVPTMFVPQSGDVSTLFSQTIGCSEVTSNPNMSSATSVGDKISSFRSMLRRYYPLVFSSNDAATGQLMNVRFFSMNVDTIGIEGIGVVTTRGMPDYLSIIGSCYGMFRGGVRVRNVVNSAISTNAKPTAASIMKTFTAEITSTANSNFYNWFFVTGSDNTQTPHNSHVHLQDLRNNSIVTTEVPQYSKYYARSVCDVINDTLVANTNRMNDSINSSCTQTRLFFVAPVSSETGIVSANGRNLHNLFRALADDGDFSVFISVPPMVNLTSTSFTNGYV